MDADAILMQTLRFDGEIVLEEAAGNSLVPVVFNNLTGANFVRWDGDPTKFHDYLKFMSGKFSEGKGFTIGEGLLEVLVGEQVVASCAVGELKRVTKEMIDVHIENLQRSRQADPSRAPAPRG